MTHLRKDEITNEQKNEWAGRPVLKDTAADAGIQKIVYWES